MPVTLTVSIDYIVLHLGSARKAEVSVVSRGVRRKILLKWDNNGDGELPTFWWDMVQAEVIEQEYLEQQGMLAW